MNLWKEAALWLAVFGSVAGVGWSLHEWERVERGATTSLPGAGASLECAADAAASPRRQWRAYCGARPAFGAPAVIRFGDVGMD